LKEQEDQEQEINFVILKRVIYGDGIVFLVFFLQLLGFCIIILCRAISIFVWTACLGEKNEREREGLGGREALLGEYVSGPFPQHFFLPSFRPMLV